MRGPYLYCRLFFTGSDRHAMKGGKGKESQGQGGKESESALGENGRGEKRIGEWILSRSGGFFSLRDNVNRSGIRI